MTLILRYMQVGDISEVAYIDRLSFDPAWPPRSYAYEINESSHSYMVVLEQREQKPLRGWRRLLQQWTIGREELEEQRHIVGYGGLWKIADEAHISTIATHPDHRGRGYGEILLAAMVRKARLLQAGYIVLEVRVSNTIAQKLYRKYEFEIFGTKPNYYRNDNEDAYDMRLLFHDDAIAQRCEQRYDAIARRVPFRDYYSSTAHPRLG